jgi:ATP-dependent Clp protease protease subunit
MKAVFNFLVLGALLGIAQEVSCSANSSRLIRLKEDNFVTLRGPITGRSASLFIDELMDKNTDELFVFISTPGGSVTSGYQIVQTMKALEEKGVKITCISNVALSMGFVVTQYCQERLVMPSSILMQHQAALGVEGSIRHIDAYMSFIHSMTDEIDLDQATRMKLTLDQFRDKYHDDWWMMGNDAVKNNAADRSVYVLCDFKPKTVTVVFPTWFGDLNVIYSTCPVARDPLRVEWSLTNNVTMDKETLASYEILFDMSRFIDNSMSGSSLMKYHKEPDWWI